MKNKITQDLITLQNPNNALFIAKLIPTIDPKTILGTKIPLLRKYTKQCFKTKDYQSFLDQTPHNFFEENLVHGFLIEQMKDLEQSLIETEKYLPLIDNRATCDSFLPKIFSKYPDIIYKKVKIWIKSSHTYTVRFAIWILLSNFLDKEFNPEILNLVASIQNSEYYIQMMQARYFATALAKQPIPTLNLIKSQTLTPFVQNKTIQKARESLRIPTQLKTELLNYKIYPRK